MPSKQVICVTHLPQIAAYGDAHLVVDKRHAADTTVSEIRSLDARERVAGELAEAQREREEAAAEAERLANAEPETTGRRTGPRRPGTNMSASMTRMSGGSSMMTFDPLGGLDGL